MNSFERFDAAMRHSQPDRIPLDFCATGLTGIRPGVQQRLKDLLGFTGPGPLANNEVDERLLEWAGTDFRSVGTIANLPSSLERRISATCFVDCWGVQRELIDGEWQITASPLRGATLEDLRAFPWPEPRIAPADLDRWLAEAKKLHADGRYVVIAEHPVFGILELGCWMCGYDDFLLRLAADPDFVRAFFDRVLALQLEIIEPYYRALGPYITLTTSGDDFGMQTGPLLSPARFEQLVMPYFKERIARTKDWADCYYWHHTCGSVDRLLDRLIACGVDILDPIQTSAAGMQPASLKARFGDRIVFWGAVDVQQFLRESTPAVVRAGVRELVDVLGTDGGYVMAPAHQIPDDVPAENIIAWIEGIR